MTTHQPRERSGVLMARAYAGSWRAHPPSHDLTLNEVAAVVLHLLEWGGVGVVWPRLREDAAELGVAGLVLAESYLEAQRHNACVPVYLVRAVSALQASGIDPVLLKGWSISRKYPLPAVRVAGDIDLLVTPGEFARAQEVLDRDATVQVDLHHDGMWVDLPRPDVRRFTHTVELAGTHIRVLNPEIELSVLAHHFMRHACVRPLWLCDVAMAIESRPADFDWDLFLGDDERRRNWLITAIGLAHHLLGAEIEDIPFADEAKRLPAWLVPAVLDRWEKGEYPPPAVLEELSNQGPVQTFVRRWPEPIAATVYLRVPFNAFPRFPIQLASYLKRIVIYGGHTLPMQLMSARGRRGRRRVTS